MLMSSDAWVRLIVGTLVLFTIGLLTFCVPAPADIQHEQVSACIGGETIDEGHSQEHLRACLEFRFPEWDISGPDSRIVHNLPPLMPDLNLLRAAGLPCGGPVPPVAWSWALTTEALHQAEYLQASRTLTHTGPDGSTSSDRGKRAGYAWCRENVGGTTTDAHRILRAWIDSPSHCSTLVDPRATAYGAAMQGGYWVLMLCAREWPW
jgi:hypothetical protein